MNKAENNNSLLSIVRFWENNEIRPRIASAAYYWNTQNLLS